MIREAAVDKEDPAQEEDDILFSHDQIPALEGEPDLDNDMSAALRIGALDAGLDVETGNLDQGETRYIPGLSLFVLGLEKHAGTVYNGMTRLRMDKATTSQSTLLFDL